jgi:hypothetical protein
LAASGTRVLVLTTFDLDEYVYKALRVGASGFLLKDVGPRELAPCDPSRCGRRSADCTLGHEAADRGVRGPAEPVRTTRRRRGAHRARVKADRDDAPLPVWKCDRMLAMRVVHLPIERPHWVTEDGLDLLRP